MRARSADPSQDASPEPPQAPQEPRKGRQGLAAQTGSTIKPEIGATGELVGEEYSLPASKTREVVRNGVLAIKTRIGGTLGGLTRSRIAPPSVQSGSSAERALGMRREKVIRNDSDVGHVTARVAYRDDEGMGGSRGSAGLPWPPGRVPALGLRDESKPRDALSGDSDADCYATAVPGGASQAVAVAAPSMLPLPAARMVNRHPTRCDCCGDTVASGEGWVWREVGQPTWRGRHQCCPGKKGRS